MNTCFGPGVQHKAPCLTRGKCVNVEPSALPPCLAHVAPPPSHTQTTTNASPAAAALGAPAVVQEEGQEEEVVDPIIKIFAKKCGRGFAFWGLPRRGSKYEKLDSDWVTENFSSKGFGSFIDQLKAVPGERKHVPNGSSARTVDLVEVSDSRVGCSVASGSDGSLGPSVHFQGDKPFCVSYGSASALRFVGFHQLADHLIDRADEIVDRAHEVFSSDHQIAKVVQLVIKSGGWVDTPEITRFGPLRDRSPHVTIAQLFASDGDNTHVVAIAGDWLFDSNRDFALPLTADSLDMACVGKVTFSHVSYAVRLIPGKKLLKRMAVASEKAAKKARACHQCVRG